MTESHEIDNLRRKIEDAKMKLVTEIKVTDLLCTSFITYVMKILDCKGCVKQKPVIITAQNRDDCVGKNLYIT